MAKELDIDAIVARVKAELQDDAMAARRDQEIKKVEDQIEQLENDSTLKEVEKEMHLAFLSFNKARLELAYSDIEKAKEFEKAESEFNKEQNVSAIRINPQGDSVIELRVPESKIDNFDGLLIASKEYWEDLIGMIEDIKNA